MCDFLLDSKLCVANGRITPEFDNFTSVSTKGKAVVDYFIIPVEMVPYCKQFQVYTARSLVNTYCDLSEMDVNVAGGIPDHSVLVLTAHTGFNGKLYDSEETTADVNQLNRNMLYESNVADLPDTFYKRHYISAVPEGFLTSDFSTQAILILLERIELCHARQKEIDDIYKSFCDIYTRERNSWFKWKNVHPLAQKKLKRCLKPFWNTNLQALWDILCEKEKVFVTALGNDRNRKRHDFKLAQNNFDREYRRSERAFRYSKQMEIESVSTSDPKKFWQTLKNLGPQKKCHIPFEIYKDNCEISNDFNDVMATWKEGFQNLYAFVPLPDEFNDTFYEHILQQKAELENRNFSREGLNHEISENEVRKIICNLKNKKAVGIDNLPNEIFKNESSVVILTKLFNLIFRSGIIPKVWTHAIIKPIPKNSVLDPRLPSNYRGISLLSTVYKCFASILNERLVDVIEGNNLYADEQNGFRRNRSCIDHIFALTSIIRSRKSQRKSTFVAYIDMEKAFDRVDRHLMLYKLLSLGIGGNMYKCLSSIYNSCQAAVNINGHITSWFNSDFGVRQGDSVSPTLFGIYINDLVHDLKNTGCGISVDNEKIQCLLYADDIALIGDSEEDLQNLLDCVYTWCKKWRMRINIKKSKVVHFRTKSVNQTQLNFKFGTEILDKVDKYKYLGIVMDEFLDFSTTASILAESGGRALGAIYSKFKYNKGLGFKTYSKMYDVGISPILDYCSGVWGFAKFEKIDTIQNRAIRLFLGVHKFAPNAAINGDMGWVYSLVRRKGEMLKLWNRLVAMENDRLTKRIFMWDKTVSKHNWCSDVFKVMQETDNQLLFYNNEPVDVDTAYSLLHEKTKENWSLEMCNAPKLRTYCTYKKEYETEPYVHCVVNRSCRSFLAQLRCGILPLKIETGRYQNIPTEFRLCEFCNQNACETEPHFLFHCSFYEIFREILYTRVINIQPDFLTLPESDKLTVLMSKDAVKHTAKFIQDAYIKRRKALYN